MLSPGVRIENHSVVDGCVVMNNSRVGQNCTLHNVILDKNVVVPDGVQIGVDHEADEARGFTVSDNGITVVPKNVEVTPV
ncbi:Glucose-1-phosphate adenylyltransferase [bioreactor metagenome]|uniref:Glucose-1-phosphate adenylyltransferase n=1 Tax=bioreactor metagenome TaxID=1076179 RepID=A0A645IV24_9ZZZZ